MKKILSCALIICTMLATMMGQALATAALPAGTQAVVPVLLYHHLAPTAGNGMTVSTKRFEEQLHALELAGFHTVTSADLIAFVDEGKPLPTNPIWLTFDDGYASNLTIAAPALAKHNMKSTIFAIGVTDGATTYRNTGIPITPHFSYAQANPWIEKGTIEVMSHGYDLHQVEALDGKNCRMGAIFLPKESLFSFMDNFLRDVDRSRTDIEAATGVPVTAFSYPYGQHNAITEGILQQMGMRISVTIQPSNNILTVGDPDSLFALGRHFALESHSGEALVHMIRTASTIDK